MQRLRMSSGEENMRWPVGLPLNLPLPIASLNHESQTSFASFVDNENELFLAPFYSQSRLIIHSKLATKRLKATVFPTVSIFIYGCLLKRRSGNLNNTRGQFWPLVLREYGWLSRRLKN